MCVVYIMSVFSGFFHLDMSSGSEESHISDEVGISDVSETDRDEIDDGDRFGLIKDLD